MRIRRPGRLAPETLFALFIVSVVCASNAVASPSGDARRALNRVLPDLNLTGVTLNDAIEFLRDVSGTNLHVNWPALEAVGVSKETPINVRLRHVSLRKVLTLVLNESSSGTALTFYVDDGVIEVTTREIADKQLVTRLYPIEDLIVEIPDFVGPNMNLDSGNSGGRGGGGGGGGNIFDGGGNGNNDRDRGNTTRAERAQALIDMITSTVEPDAWQVNGGTAAIRFFNGSLIVTAPRSVHEALGGPVD
jgi:hypothetical protein